MSESYVSFLPNGSKVTKEYVLTEALSAQKQFIGQSGYSVLSLASIKEATQGGAPIKSPEVK